MKKYDYLIVGAGLFGSIFAYEASKSGKRCLVIDKRNHLGGNLYTEKINGINVHKYGPHIFHTNSKEIWDYINQFTRFKFFRLEVIANYKNHLYNMPFNMNTFNKLWPNVITPEQAKAKIAEQTSGYNFPKEMNLEDQAIKLVGKEIYSKLIKGYTEKQWGKKCNRLPAFIIRRLPVRFNFDNNYYYDEFQGIPEDGYVKIFEEMLKNCDVELGKNYFDNRNYYDSIADKIVFTGKIDEFYNYKYGILEYRSLRFEEIILENIDNFQGTAAMSYTDKKTPFTRIIEHKHFEKKECSGTIITKEYPVKWEKNLEAYYPVNDENNNKLYNKYSELSKKDNNVIFGGRLGEYKYYDMDKVVVSALECCKKNL